MVIVEGTAGEVEASSRASLEANVHLTLFLTTTRASHASSVSSEYTDCHEPAVERASCYLSAPDPRLEMPLSP